MNRTALMTLRRRRSSLRRLFLPAAVAIGLSASMARANPIVAVPPSVVTVQPVPVDTSAASFFQPYIDWMTKRPMGFGNYSIGFTMVSNQKNEVASYAEGELRYVPPIGLILRGGLIDPSFDGQGTQYFNDRQFQMPDCNQQPGTFNVAPWSPFNPLATDKLKVDIDAKTGQVTLTLLSWGNARLTFNTVCDPVAGLIYGFAPGNAAAPKTMCVFSFKKLFAAIPR